MSSGKLLADILALHIGCNSTMHHFRFCMYGCVQEQAALREQLHGLNARLSAAERGQRAAEDTAQQEQAQKQAAVQASSTLKLVPPTLFRHPPVLLCDTFSCL